MEIINKIKITDSVKKMLHDSEQDAYFRGTALFYGVEMLSTLTADPVKSESSIGHDCIILIQKNYFRSKMLVKSYFDGLNNQNIFSAALACRAHYELTGVLTYLLKKYEQYLEDNLSYDEFCEVIVNLSYGVRDKKSFGKATPDPVGAMSLIDSVDKFAKKNLQRTSGLSFRSCYDLLSEFCHPNSIGNILVSEIGNGQYKFKEAIESYDNGSNYFTEEFFLSTSIYMNVYSAIQLMLEEHAEIPFSEYKKIMESKSKYKKEN